MEWRGGSVGRTRSDGVIGFASSAGKSRFLGTTSRVARSRSRGRRWSCSLSEPFVRGGSVFDYPRIVTLSGSVNDWVVQLGLPSERPDILGLCTWFVVLYFGFSDKIRLGTALRKTIAESLERANVGKDVADGIATAFHTFPFIFGALFIDSVLRGSLGPGFAASGGIFLSLWAMIFELGRPKERSEEELEEERQAFQAFCEFAEKSLDRRGRCHYVDVATEFRRQYPK
mmetsp:Transcript_27910/g.109474  ORF Transcript_27910/g.109474 Transcript_27910/m.109474 type:complete len:229 (+) Transcript_27910:141-827(+)